LKSERLLSKNPSVISNFEGAKHRSILIFGGKNIDIFGNQTKQQNLQNQHAQASPQAFLQAQIRTRKAFSRPPTANIHCGLPQATQDMWALRPSPGHQLQTTTVPFPTPSKTCEHKGPLQASKCKHPLGPSAGHPRHVGTKAFSRPSNHPIMQTYTHDFPKPPWADRHTCLL
jgi:hypothetical protein